MLVIQMSRGTWRPKWRNQAPIQPARPQPEPPDVEELRVADVELEQQQHDVDMSNEDDNVDQRRGVEDREDDDPEGGRCNDSDDQRIAEVLHLSLHFAHACHGFALTICDTYGTASDSQEYSQAAAHCCSSQEYRAAQGPLAIRR